MPDFIALRGDPSDGIPGAPGSEPRPPPSCCASTARLEALLEQAERQCESAGFGDLRAARAETLHENAELLRTFKQVATLVEIDVERPPDTPTDFAAGAAAAARAGMKRLAERLTAAGSRSGR